MKKLIALALAVLMLLSLGACSVQKTEPAAPAAPQADAPAEPAAAAPVEISLWTYPIGDWGKQEVVD